MEIEIIKDEDQMLTLHIFNHGYDVDLCVSLVYAKCTHEERLPLWESLYNLAEGTDISWLVGGDFNTICSQKEKLGGRPVTEVETRDFKHCQEVCNLEDIGL